MVPLLIRDPLLPLFRVPSFLLHFHLLRLLLEPFLLERPLLSEHMYHSELLFLPPSTRQCTDCTLREALCLDRLLRLLQLRLPDKICHLIVA
jgi:hypothetical protein